VKILAAAIQMSSEPLAVASNLAKADALLREAHDAGVDLAVLPEMFNTGYGLLPDYGPSAEGVDGPTLRHLSIRSREWGMSIAGGFVERAGRHLHDSVAFATPDGRIQVYRKRNLVFWERFRFQPGRDPLVVTTPWGRIGFAVCADMIYRRVWDDYKDRIDLAIVAAAWPDFADRDTGRKHWLFGHVGPLSGAIPGKVAKDLGIPVVFSNQCGVTQTVIPILGTRISDRFAGLSSLSDGLHGPSVVAGTEEQVLLAPLTVHSPRGPRPCRSTSPSAPVASSSGSAPASSESWAPASTGERAVDEG
jgi:N-carbamoylputrescine amidase